jgi:hypothetical protein
VLAVTVLADQSVRYSWDGGAVASVAALSGTYAPPTSGDPLRIGVSTLGNAPATTIQPVAMRWYSTELSDADLVAVAASRARVSGSTASVGRMDELSAMTRAKVWPHHPIPMIATFNIPNAPLRHVFMSTHAVPLRLIPRGRRKYVNQKIDKYA